jgi:hypothetical protein
VGAGEGPNQQRRCRARRCGVEQNPRSYDLGASRAASLDPLCCVVGPDPVEGQPCSIAFLNAGLAHMLLVEFGAVDLAGCRRVAWRLLLGFNKGGGPMVPLTLT